MKRGVEQGGAGVAETARESCTAPPSPRRGVGGVARGAGPLAKVWQGDGETNDALNADGDKMTAMAADVARSKGLETAAHAARARRADRPARLEVEGALTGERLELAAPKGEEAALHDLMADAFGSESNAFVTVSMTQMLTAISRSCSPDELGKRLTAALAMIAGISPGNEMEAALAAQMVSAHYLAMKCFRLANEADDVERLTAFSGLASKSARTYALHMEALAKLRRGGEQVVRHVHVNEGGQAVIANTITTGGGR